MNPKGLMTSIVLTNSGKHNNDLVDTIQNSQGNNGY